MDVRHDFMRKSAYIHSLILLHRENMSAGDNISNQIRELNDRL